MRTDSEHISPETLHQSLTEKIRYLAGLSCRGDVTSDDWNIEPIQGGTRFKIKSPRNAVLVGCTEGATQTAVDLTRLFAAPCGYSVQRRILHVPADSNQPIVELREAGQAERVLSGDGYLPVEDNPDGVTRCDINQLKAWDSALGQEIIAGLHSRTA